jgi:hypothetical protein
MSSGLIFAREDTQPGVHPKKEYTTLNVVLLERWELVPALWYTSLLISGGPAPIISMWC